MKNSCLIILFFIPSTYLVTSCNEPSENNSLKEEINHQLSAIDGDVALAFYNLSDTTLSFSIRGGEEFHAASTMKVPVMIEVFRQMSEGRFNLQDSLVLKNEFKSIVDSSLYQLDVSDDSDDILYSRIGQKATIYELVHSMITVSSNFATNMLIDLVNAKNVTNTMRSLGASDINVLRGVEDIKAFNLGLSNTTTANDLMIIMRAIARGEAGNSTNCHAMISILKEQEFNSVIPELLPNDVEIAHKTGFITGIQHDAAIVYLPDGQSYVLIILSKNLSDVDEAKKQMAEISKTIYNYISSR